MLNAYSVFLMTHFVENQEITGTNISLILPSLCEPMYLYDKYWLASCCVTLRKLRIFVLNSETFKMDRMKIGH